MHFQDTESLYRTKDPDHFHLKEFIDKTSRVEGFSEVRRMLYKRDTQVSLLTPAENLEQVRGKHIENKKFVSVCYN